MELRAKIIHIQTGGPLIATLHRDDAIVLDINPGDRIQIKKGNKRIVAAIDIELPGGRAIKKGRIGLLLDLASYLKVKENQIVKVNIAPKPPSLDHIKKKLQGKELTKKEIDQIITDLLKNSLTEIESTYFVAGSFINKLTLNEATYLTEAIAKHGGRLKFKKKPIVDKHCVSGVPGNRTTMLIVPIVAAAGLTIPKTSSRAITSPSGTSDSVEVLAPVTFSKNKILNIVKKTGGCMVWGGTVDLASADDKLIKLEKPLGIDPEGFLLASILAKKSAADSTHVLIDIPVGSEAKIKNKKRAKDLGNKFINLGKKLNLKIKVIITDGSQPIGNGIGPALEARDVLLVLQNRGPKDLTKKALMMSSLILKMAGIKNPKHTAKNILERGLAYKKMKEIIKAQGGNPNIQPEDIKPGRFKYNLKSQKSGKIKHINNITITRLAKAAGAPADKKAGVYLYKKVNDKVNKNEILLTIYAETKEKLNFAKRILKENPFKI